MTARSSLANYKGHPILLLIWLSNNNASCKIIIHIMANSTIWIH